MSNRNRPSIWVIGRPRALAIQAALAATAFLVMMPPIARSDLNPEAAKTATEAVRRNINPCAAKTLNPCAAKTLNPCAAKTLNPCAAKTLNPCAAKTLNPSAAKTLNPCAAKTLNPLAAKTLNPCAAKTLNPCAAKTLNPCAAKTLNRCAAATLNPCAAKTLNRAAAAALNPCLAKTLSAIRARDLTVAEAGVGGAGCESDAALAQTSSACNPCNPCGCGGAGIPVVDPLPASSIMQMIQKEFEEYGRQETTLTTPLIGHKRDIHVDAERAPDYWSVLQVTQETDPLLTDECRQSAVTRAVAVSGGDAGAKQHAHNQNVLWGDVLRGNENLTLEEYFEHAAECEAFCGPLLALLLTCHLEAVKAHDKMLVLFSVGEPRRGEEQGYRLSADTLSSIQTFVRRAGEENRRVILYGRASKLYSDEAYSPNPPLAGRRISVVSEAFRDAGYRGAIAKAPIIWQPPRLSVFEVADAMGLGDQFSTVETPAYLDQSVIAVSY